MKQSQKKRGAFALHLGMAALSLVFVYPLVWMVLTSLKTKQDVMQNPFGLPGEWMFSNYVEAFEAFEFPLFLLNSAIYTAGTILLTLVCSVMFAYPR